MAKVKNFNESFNEEFCTYLEFHLCATFGNSDDEEWKRFWCDGVHWAPFFNDEQNKRYLSLEAVAKRKNIDTRAKIGVSGQDPYDMRIILGMRAQAAYQASKSMIHCIPNKQLNKWIEIDSEQKTIIIKLK